MEEVEVGPQKFSENLRWLLCKGEMSKGDLGQKAYGPRLIPENGRKRICRLLNGQVELKVQDVDVIASIFGVPPAVLAYGTKDQLEKSWSTRHQRRMI